MAIKNFTLAGVSALVNFGKGNATLKGVSSTQLEVRDNVDSAFANLGGADAVAVTDFVTLAQLNAVSAGISWKEAVRLCETSNISIASAPATIDGIAPTIGDRIALTAQTTGSEDGLWIWNGAAVALTRPTDWATTTNQSGSAFFITEGTCADLAYVATADPAIVDTDDPLLLQFASVSAGVSSIANAAGITGIPVLQSGAAPIPTFRAILGEIGVLTAALVGTDVVVSVDALGITGAKVANSTLAEGKLTAGTAVLYRHLQVVAADFPATPSSLNISIGVVLPTNAIVQGGIVLVTTAFDNTPDLEAGVAASPTDVFAANEVDLSATGTCVSSKASLQSGTQLIVRLTNTGTQPTAGSAEVMVNFARVA